VTKDTKRIIVEFAKFPHNVIRNTAIRLNLSTDASRRFSKPVTIYSIELASTYINGMFKSCSVSKPRVKITKEGKQISIHANFKKMTDLVGIEISKNDIIQYLK
jgi:phenylalanyl-tRNA synthetase beta subunit